MIYSEVLGDNVSRLGFGTMRFPLTPGGSISQAKVNRMIDEAYDNGVNYFDTAYPYHGGNSELSLAKALKNKPRDSYYIADKFPGHSLLKKIDNIALFNKQLQKCNVEYFDYFLFHNVMEGNIENYENEEWGVFADIIKMKEEGKIRHLGLSSHASFELLERIIKDHRDVIDFVQIQLNYLDWSLQDAERKYKMLTNNHIPVWVMEPVRGGKLASIAPKDEAKLKALRPEESIASWAFRWLMDLDNVKVILSGMSTIEQVRDNIMTFSDDSPLSKGEKRLLHGIAESLKDSVPCTGCRYCTKTCPMNLDIPRLIGFYNDLKFASSFTPMMAMESMPKEKLAHACLSCGSCAKLCPQHINIPEVMKNLALLYDKTPKWTPAARDRSRMIDADLKAEKAKSDKKSKPSKISKSNKSVRTDNPADTKEKKAVSKSGKK